MTLSRAAIGGLALPFTAFIAIDAVEPSLQDQLDELRRQNAELASRLDAVENDHSHAAPAPGGASAGGATALRLIDISLDILTAVGGSTATDAELASLQGGGHDPKRRGFTLQAAELSLVGAVDPYFVAEAHLVAFRSEPEGETVIELEEAFARSTSLPAGLEVKTGLYLLEFGRFNPTHPHAWQFIDQPVIIGRVFSGDGQRTPGARVSWSMPTPWLSDLTAGLMDANGETAPSFLSNDEAGTVGGRAFVEHGTRSPADLLSTARWANAFDFEDAMAKVGASFATGPNAASDDTRTTVWGVDAALRWRPAGSTDFVLLEAEFLERLYETPEAELLTGGVATGTVDATTLHDRGVVLQAVYGFAPRWAAGLRFEQCWGSGKGLEESEDGLERNEVDRSSDPTRDDRTRISPLITWQPSEFTHFRLQYNHDRADHLDDTEHTVWLGAEFLIGAHPAHTF